MQRSCGWRQQGITNIHAFENGGSTSTASDSGSATGIRDIILRGKYHFLRATGGGLAVAVDVRTPTGDEENLLGAGATQAKFQLVASGADYRFAPHFNIGYTFAGESSTPFVSSNDEFNYTGGAEFVVSPKLTIAGDIIGRQLQDSGRLVEEAKTFNWTTAQMVSGSSTFMEFASRPGNLNLVLGAAGLRFNPGRNLLISANLVFPWATRACRAT